MMRKSLLPLLLTLALLFSALPLTAYATEENDVPPIDPLPVSEPTDSPQAQEVSTLEELLAAIAAADDGDTIVLNNTIHINQNCVIGDAEKVITLIPSEGFTAGTFLTVPSFSEQNITIQNLNLDGRGAPLSAVVVNYGSFDDMTGQIEMSHINISNFASEDSPVTLSAVNAVVKECTFSNNTCTRTAGIEVLANSEAIFESCTFANNTSGRDGGAIRCMGKLELRNSVISNNKAGIEVDRPCVGGGIYIDSNGSGILYSCTITDNSANLGGGIATYGKIEIVDSLIYGNKGAMGASDIYAPNKTPLSVTYTNGMDTIYTENDPIGYYADYFENPFDPVNHAVFFGESLSIDKTDNLFGAKFIFAADLPSKDEEEQTPPTEEVPDTPDESPSTDPIPVEPDETPTTPQQPDRPQTTPSRPSRPVHEDTPSQVQPEEPQKLTLSFGGATLDTETPLMLYGYGDGDLGENDPITRAQIAELLYRALDADSKLMLSDAESTFADVTAEDWYYNSVTAFASAGVIQGYDGLYHPSAPLTLGQLITLLTRFVEEKETTMPVDIQYKEHWAYSHIVTAVAYGWIEDATEIDPDRPVTRGETVVWINSIFESC